MKTRALFLAVAALLLAAPASARDASKRDPIINSETKAEAGKTSPLFRPSNIMAMGEQSGQEILMLSFYRNANAKPDFKKWSYLTQRAAEAPEYDRAVVALNEQVRLQTIYTNLDPSGYLNIQAPVDVTQYSSSQEKLFIPSFSNRGKERGGSLVQNIYGEQIAVVIPELSQFAAIHMTNADAKFFYEAIKKVAEDKNKLEDAVIAELLVKPANAIYRKNNRVGMAGTQSIFTVQLAQLTLWRKGKKPGEEMPLWSWKADWYKPDDDNPALLQLYKALN